MTITHRAQYLTVTAVVLAATGVQIARGIRPLIIVIAAVAFLIVGNLIVYLSGSRQRALRRQQKRDYYAGL